jgi:8-oxo-dGTP diphosphatase
MSVPVGLKRSAVLCILHSPKGILLICRKNEPHVGKYVPIGGHIDPYETPRAAVIREVEEEAGVTIPDVRLCGIMTETSPTKYNWIVYVYLADIAAIEPREHREGILEWVAPERLTQLPIPKIDRFIYEYVTRAEFFIFDAVYNRNIELIRLVNEITGTVLVGES